MAIRCGSCGGKLVDGPVIAYRDQPIEKQPGWTLVTIETWADGKVSYMDIPVEHTCQDQGVCGHFNVTRGELDGSPIWTCVECADQFLPAETT